LFPRCDPRVTKHLDVLEIELKCFLPVFAAKLSFPISYPLICNRINKGEASDGEEFGYCGVASQGKNN
jgi:hypothetical protein